jgi:beta-galactosidase/beta-glucuronidase
MRQVTSIKGLILLRLMGQVLLILGVLASTGVGQTDTKLKPVPLAEHPRPDLQRQDWINLNGSWSFRFDDENRGLGQDWQSGNVPFQEEITVPFSWGAPLSGVEDEADIGWYSRTVSVPASWEGKRTFLVIGACDWKTTVWLDGQELGSHQGGYTPFEFELTSGLKYGQEQVLVLRVDDSKHAFKLEGKQGYGPARGIWQTVYLEARGSIPLKTVHFSPDIDEGKVTVEFSLLEPARTDLQVEMQFSNVEVAGVRQQVAAGESGKTFDVSLPNTCLWSLDDPFLYEVNVSVAGRNLARDTVSSYFGMRKVSVVNLPGLGYPYVAINDEPVYLQMTLDQAYHPEGFYTFPSDAFMRDEIIRSLKIGLNGMRIHVKIEAPRKLYWADRLGMLIMADVPNSWGNPTSEMRAESEHALRGMIERDFNHPSIFSWVIFNETWGLNTEGEGYLKETQDWVASMYHLAKELDPTRLVEDNSPNKKDHVVTDINSWHAYLPGYAWRESLKEIVDSTLEGSEWNFVEGRTQGSEPLFNSECGNVWGYEELGLPPYDQ